MPIRSIALRYVEEKTIGQCTFGGVATGRKKFSTDLNAKSPFYTQHSSLHFSNFYAHPFFSHLRPNIMTRFSPPNPLPVSHCALSQKLQLKHNTFPRLPFTFFFSFMFIHSPAHTPFELCHAVCLVVSFFSSLTRRHRRLPKVDQRIHPPHRGSALKEGQLSCRHL